MTEIAEWFDLDYGPRRQVITAILAALPEAQDKHAFLAAAKVLAGKADQHWLDGILIAGLIGEQPEIMNVYTLEPELVSSWAPYDSSVGKNLLE